jgi:hypothetical protein
VTADYDITEVEGDSDEEVVDEEERVADGDLIKESLSKIDLNSLRAKKETNPDKDNVLSNPEGEEQQPIEDQVSKL